MVLLSSSGRPLGLEFLRQVEEGPNTVGRPVAQQPSSMKIIPVCFMVLSLLRVLESGLLGIPSGPLHNAGTNLGARYRQVDRLGCPCDRAVDLVEDDLLGKPKEAIVGPDVGWKVLETGFDILLPDTEQLRGDGNRALNDDGGESRFRGKPGFPRRVGWRIQSCWLVRRSVMQLMIW
jgi:hypothetical protein